MGAMPKNFVDQFLHLHFMEFAKTTIEQLKSPRVWYQPQGHKNMLHFQWSVNLLRKCLNSIESRIWTSNQDLRSFENNGTQILIFRDLVPKPELDFSWFMVSRFFQLRRKASRDDDVIEVLTAELTVLGVSTNHSLQRFLVVLQNLLWFIPKNLTLAF